VLKYYGCKTADTTAVVASTAGATGTSRGSCQVISEAQAYLGNTSISVQTVLTSAESRLKVVMSFTLGPQHKHVMGNNY
jgi:hypothetical protein